MSLPPTPPLPVVRHFAVRTQVRWDDCDPAGIAFYPRFFGWLDMLSHALAREMGVSRDDMLPPRSLGFPLIRAEAQFLAPARLEDKLEIRALVTRIGRTSFALRHEVVRVDDGTLLVRGLEERVHIDHADGGDLRPRQLTDRMREVLTSYLDPAGSAG